ncbi:MAG: hypothetical protein IT449_14285 [Phycisphaerales bacterium]|nr:hypothetical protein [Phycisphaerales bacterium]
MNPTQELADALFRDKLATARATPPEERLLDGPRLFDFACALAIAGIKDQFPDADEAQVRRILEERLELVARLEVRR